MGEKRLYRQRWDDDTELDCFRRRCSSGSSHFAATRPVLSSDRLTDRRPDRLSAFCLARRFSVDRPAAVNSAERAAASRPRDAGLDDALAERREHIVGAPRWSRPAAFDPRPLLAGPERVPKARAVRRTAAASRPSRSRASVFRERCASSRGWLAGGQVPLGGRHKRCGYPTDANGSLSRHASCRQPRRSRRPVLLDDLHRTPQSERGA
jgi:hypothetical protein